MVVFWINYKGRGEDKTREEDIRVVEVRGDGSMDQGFGNWETER